MGIINKITKETDNKFLNLYCLDRTNKVGNKSKYYMASRAKSQDDLKIRTKNNKADGVIVYSVYGEKKDKVVLIRQYRYPLDSYVYEFPAGLVDEGEDFKTAGIREMKEETGLDLEVIPVSEAYEKPYYMSVGMTDECCGTVYGYASGMVTEKYQEEAEEIEVVIADKAEVARILKEEQLAIVCSYMLMHFLHDEDPFAFLQ
ncbi:MAG: NUDIX hydrolase [Lachnospiraceae bacterium]|nr:NUDIX hydrolase [Lachnospiraceae bacterium]